VRAAAWIAWRELANRPLSMLVAVATISVAVAVCAATELVHRSREVAVSAQVDFMGPGLRLIPGGRTSRDLVRFELGPETFPAETALQLRREFSDSVRATEGRLLLRGTVEGVDVPLLGLDPAVAVSSVSDLRELTPGNVVLGGELARKLGKARGARLSVKGAEFNVAGILPSTASVEDLALILTLADLRAMSGSGKVINELRVYPLPGVAPAELAPKIRESFPGLAVTLPDNDDVTRTEVDKSLSGLRWIVYSVTALVAAFCVLVWSNLNASERRVEMATLVAIGGSAWTVFMTLALRVCIIAVAGALLGNAVAVAIALAQDFSAARSVVWSSQHLLVWPAASALVGVLGALPITLRSAMREHVRDLQS
jgi:ABC-type lipoprotein release transport system permease subunit